jgi:hypothetical protein
MASLVSESATTMCAGYRWRLDVVDIAQPFMSIIASVGA